MANVNLNESSDDTTMQYDLQLFIQFGSSTGGISWTLWDQTGNNMLIEL